MLCHMFRGGLKKALVSHGSSVVEEDVASPVSSVLEEACCVTCFAEG